MSNLVSCLFAVAKPTKNQKMSFSLRQFEDIQILAERIEQGDHFESDLEMFARFSEDMRTWLLQNFDDPMIVQRTQKIPHIDFEKSKTSLWDVLPGGGGISIDNRYVNGFESFSSWRSESERYCIVDWTPQ